VQLESVPICSTVDVFQPSIPTQVAEVDTVPKLQFAVGTVQLADAAVYVSLVAT
jgi:hypothetical protein